MTHWLPAALISLFSFGFWGYFTKLTINYIDTRSALIFQTLGVTLIGILVLSQLHFKPAGDVRGISYGILTGIFYGIGCLFYFFAADKGKISTVVTLTALYPIVTIVLSFILIKESISIRQMGGILLALLAIYLMTD